MSLSPKLRLFWLKHGTRNNPKQEKLNSNKTPNERFLTQFALYIVLVNFVFCILEYTCMHLYHHNIICARIVEHSTITTYSNSRNWAHEKKKAWVPGGDEKWGPQFGFGCPKFGKRRWKKQLKHWKQHFKLRYLQRKGFFSPFGLSACNEMISLLPSFWSKQSTKKECGSITHTHLSVCLLVEWLKGTYIDGVWPA